MTDEEILLARYLRQTAELGGNEIYLDTMTPAEMIAGLKMRFRGDVSAREAAPPRATPPHQVLDQIETLAASPPSREPNSVLPLLARQANVCQLCRLWEGRTHAVFGEGNANAELVVVGEAPGEEEDRTGRPFVGRAGKLLDLLLQTAGFPRETVYICNVLKCRPPGNRNPMPDEAETCTSNYLLQQLDAIDPRAILAVGKFAVQALLQTEESISRLRGKTHTYRGKPLIVSYHPAYLLRSPQMVRVAWDDYQMARRILDGEI